jgi:hypothetical protein
LSTWSCSTTASAATAHLACSARSSSRPAIPPPWHDKSSLSAPQNQAQTRASRNPGAVTGPATAKEHPAQTLLGARCHGALSRPPGLTQGRAWR